MALTLFTLKTPERRSVKSMDWSIWAFFAHGYYAPLVDLSFHYKKPIKYGMTPRIDIIYRPTEAAKIVFDYEIHDIEDDSLIATGSSVQVLWILIINWFGIIHLSTKNGKNDGDK